MGKTLGSIIGAAVGFVFLGPQGALLGLSVGGQVGGLLGGSGPKEELPSTAIKLPRPPRVSAYGTSRLPGAYILYETATDGTAVDVFAVHDGEYTEIVQLYLNDDRVTLTGNVVNEGADGRYKDGKLSLYTTTGANPGTAIAAVTAKIPEWDSDHRGDGVVQLALLSSPVKSKDFLATYPNGVPVAALAAKWQKCPDPYAADPTDQSGWTWTENNIRHLMHYLLVREGVDFATKIAPAIDFWRTAADVCDEAIPLKAGGSEARYRSCVSHKHTDEHGAVKSAILEACDGWIAPRSDGALIVYAGKYYEPTVNIGPEHIVAYEWSGVGVDDDDAVNLLVCSYVSADHDYNTVETDAWIDEDDIAERGELSDEFSPKVPSWGQCRRLAKRVMARRNAPFRGKVTTNIAGRIMRGERYINLLLRDAGTTFYDGPVEVTEVMRNMATGGVTFSWVSVDANIDEWNPATEEGDPAAKGDRVAAEPLDPPTITSADANFDAGYARIAIIGGGPDRDDLTWFARTRIDGETAWLEAEYTDTDPGTPVALMTGPVASNADIEVEIAYSLGDGRVSPWSATETVDTTTPP